MGQIINFEEYKNTINERKAKKKAQTDILQQEAEFELPTASEIMGLNMLFAAGLNNPNQEYDYPFWNGTVWQGIFAEILIPYAKENELDVWDVFAVFVMKAYGAEFLQNEDGSFAGISFPN